MSLLIIANIIKMPAVILVATSLLGGLDLIPQKQPFENGFGVPVYPVFPGRVSFAQVVSYRPLRESEEKLVDVRWAISNWKLPAGSSVSPLMTEIGRCAAFKPNFGIKSCLYMKQWWLALIVAWSCVDFLICLCGGICSTWIDGAVYVHQWHRPLIQGLLWILSGCMLIYSLTLAWNLNFSYNLKPGTTGRIYVYFKLPPNWFVAALACFTVATLNGIEFGVVRWRGKAFTVEDLERNLAEREEYERRCSRRRSSIYYGRRKSSAGKVSARRKSGLAGVQAAQKARPSVVNEYGGTMKEHEAIPIVGRMI